jgi:putative transport protein
LIDLLASQPLLLLFLVAALGFPLGQIPLAGSRLGVSAVLFSGLALGALDPRLKLPDIVFLLGLVLFIYPVGLASGPSFFAAFRRKGLRDNALVAGILVASTLLALGLKRLLDLAPELAAGLYAGSLTNTPALAAILESAARAPAADEALPVVGYSIAYPVGVLGVILAIALTRRLWRVDYEAEARTLKEFGVTDAGLQNITLTITHPDAATTPLATLVDRTELDVILTRAETEDGRVVRVGPDTLVIPGRNVTVLGTREELERAQTLLGPVSEVRLDLDRSQLDYRRIFVSRKDIAGRRIRDLRLPQRFDAVITRVRRGDVELMPDPDMELELGDRVRVVAAPEHMTEVSEFFGDSYKALAEVNILTFGLGMFAGMLLGMVPLPVAPGVTLQLGLAGGPLVVGLILGTLAFTGPLVWTVPYSANLTIRQIGLVLFFAGVGTKAGYSFFGVLLEPQGALLLGAGAVMTCGTALAALWLGHKVLKIPMSLLTGMLAGLQTQPAVLSYATEQTGNDLPNIGYATVFPTATVLKILLAQVILAGFL